jgi:RHS repeat-associated protein
VGRGFGPGPGGRPAAKEKTASSAAALAARIISMGALAVKEKLASGPKTSLAVDRLLAVAALAADLQKENVAANDELAEGAYHDAETGLFYNWNRYYDPRIGRYITSDPIGIDGGLNTYLYANASPLRFTDPMGLAPLCPPGYRAMPVKGYEKDFPKVFNCEPNGGAYSVPRGPSFPAGTCGSGWNDPFVPDNPLGSPFSDACEKHDKCYDCRSGRSRASCDDEFCDNMKNACKAYGSSFGRQQCDRMARLYCDMVRKHGQGAYDAARQ